MAKKTFLTAFLCIFAFLAFPLISSAIGQITEPIVVNDALRGQEISKKLSLINSENVKLTFQIKSRGDIKDWVAFYNLDDLSNPITEVEIAPVFYHDVSAIFKVPADLPNGTYTGYLDVIVASAKDQSDQATTVNTMVSRSVSITVSDKEVVALTAYASPVSYYVNSGSPAQIRLTYVNTGNVAIKPDVQLKVFDSANNVIFNAIFPYNAPDPVKAGATKEMPAIEWQTAGQPLGNYLTETTVTVNGQTLKTEQITFTVQKPGLAALSSLTGLDNTGIMIVVALFAITAVAVAYRFFLRKKKLVQE